VCRFYANTMPLCLRELRIREFWYPDGVAGLPPIPCRYQSRQKLCLLFSEVHWGLGALAHTWSHLWPHVTSWDRPLAASSFLPTHSAATTALHPWKEGGTGLVLPKWCSAGLLARGSLSPGPILDGHLSGVTLTSQSLTPAGLAGERGNAAGSAG
jgi:hypothetical protein